MAILHKDISHWVGTYVEPDCLARLAAACRGLVTPHLWQCRADQLWPGLELELCDGDADGLGFRAFDRAFRALHAGCRGRASQVDAARARQVLERALEAPREAPRNKVLLTLYHGATVLARGCSSITLYDQEPSGRAAERAQFELNVGHLRQLLDSWLDRHICIQRSLSRQLLVSCEMSNPDLLRALELTVVLQVWTWGDGLRVVSPHLPLRQVSQDRRGFHLHFVHVPLDGGDLSNCIELLVQLDSDGKEGESLDETCAIATLLGRTTTSRSHHQLLFDGYLSALCSLI